jgi:hypothetical protein
MPTSVATEPRLLDVSPEHAVVAAARRSGPIHRRARRVHGAVRLDLTASLMNRPG